MSSYIMCQVKFFFGHIVMMKKKQILDAKETVQIVINQKQSDKKTESIVWDSNYT